VVSELVNRRTREIGLRMALGARAADVMRMVMQRSFLLAVAGVAAGALAGAYLVRYLTSQLFQVKAGDPFTFAGAILVLLAVALMAGYLPARRAVSIDPVAALRCD
jgi:ABC-type antimicrobial peptide transport system permease subunit